MGTQVKKIVTSVGIVLLLKSSIVTAQQQSQISKVENGFCRSRIIEVGADPDRQTIYKRMEATKVRGMSVAVIDNGSIAWAKGYGLKDASDKNDSVTTTTLFQCASIGKVITALAVMQLVSENKIGLDQDVNTYLKSWKLPENNFTLQKKVTLRMLLAHSSGLKDGYGFAGYYPGTTLPTLAQMLNAKPPANNNKELKIAGLPGAEEHYSGGGYLIIQQLIEDISGKSFADFVEQQIFVPLQMTHTTYNYYPDIELKLPIARGHEANGKIDAKRKYNVYPEKAAAGPWTTATDLAKLVIAIQKASSGQTTPLPNAALIHQMLLPQINDMGLGCHLKGADKVEGLWHAGNNAGFTGMLFAVADSGQGAVVLTNSDGGEWFALEAIRSIADTYNWPIMQTIFEQKVEGIESYTGLYRVDENKALLVTIEKGNLYFSKVGSKARYRLYAHPDGSFRMQEKPDNIKFIFQKDESGNIISMTMYENAGSTVSMTKSDK